MPKPLHCVFIERGPTKVLHGSALRPQFAPQGKTSQMKQRRLQDLPNPQARISHPLLQSPTQLQSSFQTTPQPRTKSRLETSDRSLWRAKMHRDRLSPKDRPHVAQLLNVRRTRYHNRSSPRPAAGLQHRRRTGNRVQTRASAR